MSLKKQSFTEDEVAIYDDAIVYKRGNYWHFRMWLAKEQKYARFSLKTRNKSTAIDKAELHYHELRAMQIAGKTYFSQTCKDGVAMYLEQRKKHIGNSITQGRFGTIRTHLEHWLDFIGRDTKLKELERTDCEDYYLNRTKTKRQLEVSTTTIANEQSTINAMIGWLFKRHETYIEKFDFSPLPRRDKNDSRIKRATLTADEVNDLRNAIKSYLKEGCDSEVEQHNKFLACYYILIATVTGLRSGEQRQLEWSDIEWTEARKGGKTVRVAHIRIRHDTSKTGNSREFMAADNGYFMELARYITKATERKSLKDTFVFSMDGKKVISKRAIYYHFYKLLDLADINIEGRNIVPYSLRHYFITQKLNSGVQIQEVADMCGTSPNHVFNTYYHKDHNVMRSNAVADYDIDDD